MAWGCSSLGWCSPLRARQCFPKAAMICVAASTDRRAALPFMLSGSIGRRSPCDLECEPWMDGASGGYRFDMAALNPQWPVLRVSDADRDEAIKVLREG